MPSRIRLHLTHLDTTAVAKNLTIPLSFILPISTLYVTHPNSFQSTWKGRAPYLFFLWLFFLELFIAWKKISKKNSVSLRWRKTLAVATTMAAPTAYVIAVSVFGLSHWIVEIGELLGAGRYGEWFLQHSWPLSLEYLLLTAFFTASIQLMYGINGLKRFLISLFFLGATGSFYMIDTFYPYGTITVLQAFAPITASSAVHVLNWMGYKTQLALFTYMGMPVLLSPGLPPLAIGWPCAGVHSLFIYTFVILLFIKDAAIPFKWKITCIAIGAVGTFIVNVLRIVSICIIGSTAGSEAAQLFHSYYGELYFVAWILTYLTVIFLLSRRIYTKSPRSEPKPKQNGNSCPG